MTSNELRRIFLDYFRARDHQIVAGSPLVPGNDPTLLFTNSGMVQFKDVFLGAEKRNYSRATTAQPCVRAGGKHNDLDNVGYTARHHTFFEMLGNFSFGDYFKQDAIRYCWELMTEVLGLPPAKLWVTVYKDDEEAERIWFDEIGIDPARFTRCGEKDNFWAMGDTGPCGPCSEVYYDHGPDVPGGPPGSPDEEGDRYVELWNLVFMQFNRDASGAMEPLPRPSVDTGMGLERMAAVLQGVRSNYDTDLFVHLIDAAADITKSPDREDKSLRVIADHIRSCAFLINDGVVPANEGRGYVLRRIIRRAIRHGHRLGIAEPFFWRMVGALEAEMGAAYPSLSRRRAHIERTLRSEEEQFSRTLDQGMRILEESIEGLEGNTIPGETVFRLYDTYGFPADLTADIARERSLEIDLEGFEREMEGQRARARAASRFKAREDESLDIATAFCGYERLEDESVVVALLKGGEKTESLEEGDEGMVVLERTPFYAESGGQVGDRGWIAGSPDAGAPNASAVAGSPTSGESGGSGFEFDVVDTCKQGDGAVHVGALRKGRIAIGDPAFAKVDEEARHATARNHSATHLLHAALHLVLGEHVQQKGSLVAPDRLRFDFSHPHPLSKDERHRIETLVSGWILKNSEARTEIMPLDQAKQSGAIALFGEKYDDPVRVLSIGDDSTELCGGTHVRRAGDIGLFKIVSEGGISAGVRRIVALTGEGALAWVQTMSDRLDRIAETIQAAPDAAQERLEALVARNRELERTLSQLQAQAAGTQGDALADKSVDIAGIKVLATRLDDTDIASLRKVVDRLKDRLGAAAVVVATANGDKVSLVAGVTRNCTDRIKAGELANHVASQVGGRGGGRADLAQAGGNDPSRLDEALRSVSEWVQERVE
ncbi:MAG: alanine--tRNA ligase [Ectothiorhodospiraceae bacterium AqS1]|nr:alanine--tRNA ligase [Ectothiorhodospiraceae bacterium AqS1]MBF2761633.1 alanine--tRNA ligase [Ectothiorhodospiraceae bacterium AqS1]